MTDEELRSLLEANATENRRHFSETAEKLSAEIRHLFKVSTEDVRQEVRLIAEGVSDTREALSRETADIRDEVRRGFTETQAMIKFSHAELDRRVRALEESQRTVDQTLADVQARLERLESSTH